MKQDRDIFLINNEDISNINNNNQENAINSSYVKRVYFQDSYRSSQYQNRSQHDNNNQVLIPSNTNDRFPSVKITLEDK